MKQQFLQGDVPEVTRRSSNRSGHGHDVILASRPSSCPLNYLPKQHQVNHLRLGLPEASLPLCLRCQASSSGPLSIVGCCAAGLDLLSPQTHLSATLEIPTKASSCTAPHQGTRGELKNFPVIPWSPDLQGSVIVCGFPVRCWSTTSKAHHTPWAAVTPKEPRSCSFLSSKDNSKAKSQRLKKLKQFALAYFHYEEYILYSRNLTKLKF